MQLKEWSKGKVVYGVRRVVVGGCQSLGQGLFLEDARDYEIRTRDEGVKERHTKSCLC